MAVVDKETALVDATPDDDVVVTYDGTVTADDDVLADGDGVDDDAANVVVAEGIY